MDAITMWMVKNPEWFDVIVHRQHVRGYHHRPGGLIQGGMGIAAGGNINPEGYPCLNRLVVLHPSIPERT